MIFAALAFLELWWFIPFFVFCVVGAFSFGSEEDEILQNCPWFSFALVLGLAWWGGVIPTPTSVSVIWDVLIYAAMYLAVGTGWSTFKWFLLMRKIRDFIVENLTEAKKTENGTYSVKERLLQLNYSWLSKFIEKKDIHEDGSIHPSIRKNKNSQRISSWILFWPFSAINYVFGKLLTDLIDGIKRLCQGIYHAIGRAVMSDVKVK